MPDRKGLKTHAVETWRVIEPFVDRLTIKWKFLVFSERFAKLFLSLLYQAQA